MNRKISWNSGRLDVINQVYRRAAQSEAAWKFLVDIEDGALAEARNGCAMVRIRGEQLTPEQYDVLSDSAKEAVIAALGNAGITAFTAVDQNTKIVVELSPQVRRVLNCTVFSLLNRLEKLNGAFADQPEKITLEIQTPAGGKQGLVAVEMLISVLYPWLSVKTVIQGAAAAPTYRYSDPKRAVSNEPEKKREKTAKKKWLPKVIAAVVALLLVVGVVLAVGQIKNRIDDKQAQKEDQLQQEAQEKETDAPTETQEPTQCSHTWQDATCTDAAVCTLCGETDGAALGHSWVDATRTEPKTCEVCGATEGEPLGAPDISVSDRISWIADKYNDIYGRVNSNLYRLEEVSKGVYYYYDANGEICFIVNAKGNDGLGEYSDDYRRYYTFCDGELIFAYLEGKDSHRLYFYEGELMRWRYQGVGKGKAEAEIEDFTYSEEFLMWESLVLQEVEGFLN